MESTSAPEEICYRDLYEKEATKLGELLLHRRRNTLLVAWLALLRTDGELREFEENGGDLRFENLLTILEDCRKSRSLSPLAGKSTGMRYSLFFVLITNFF